MANTIKIKNSGTAANVPSAASLQYGELALNYADGKLYFKTGASTVDFLKSNITLGTDTTGNYMSGISGTSPVSVSHTPAEGSTATVSLASGYGDTKNPYASKTANHVLAAPNGSAGVPTFRAIVAADIPTLNQNTTGTAATVTGAAQTAITSVGTLTSLNVSGTATASTTITNELRTSSGQQLIINAGESHLYATGQTDEFLYVNAEKGLQVNSSPDNWGSEWAGRKTATICAADGTSSFPGTITAPTFSGSGASLTSLPAGQLTGTVASARISGSYTGITGIGTLTTLLIGQTCSTSTVAAANDTGSFSVRGNASFPAVMSFHRTGAYAVNFGLSTANKMELGGWSATTIKFTWDMATGNYDAVGAITAASFSGSGASLTSLPAGQLTGTVASARISGSYTGITGLGTLTSLTIDGPDSPSFTLGDTGFTGYSGVQGDKGYLLVGNSVGDTVIYLRSSGAGGVYLGASNSNTLQVGNGTATVAGTITASGRIWAQTDLRVGNASSTVLSSDPYALIVTPQGYTGLPVRIGEHYSIASVGTQNSQFTIFAGPASGGQIIFKRASNTTIASLQTNGLYLSEGWLRTYGARGWYSETYGGGIYMDDVNTVKVYNGKAFYVPSSISSGSGITAAGSINAGGMMGLSGAGIAYYGSSVGGGSANQIGFRWTNPYVNCTVDNVISAAAANFSDRRLKTNIQTLTNGIDLVRRLRCVKYNPLDVIGFEEETLEPIIGDLDPYDEMIGFVADEVQEVYANAIHGEGNRMKSIDTVQLLSMAVSAIQDLDARLQQLETV